MKIILRVSVQQSRWMIKLVPYVNWDVREKTSCCDIIETNNVNKSLKRRDAVPQREGYTPPSPPPISLYPYRAYIETLLSYGPAAKESQLTGVMWYKDTPGHQDKTAALTKDSRPGKHWPSTSSCMQNLTTWSKSIETDKSCLTIVHNEYARDWHSIEKTSPPQTGV